MSERQSNLTKRRRSAVSIMGSLIGLVKPLLHIMIAAIILGMAGYLCAIFLTILAGQVIVHGILTGETGAAIAAKTTDLVLTSQTVGITVKNLWLINTPVKTIIIIMIIIAVLRGILHYAEQYCNHFIAFKLLAVIRHKVFAALRKLCPAKLEGRERGNLISIITSDIELLEVFYAHTISPIAIAVFTSAIMVIFISKQYLPAGMIALVAYVVIGVVLPLFNGKAGADDGMEFRDSFGQLNSFILDSLRGLDETIQFHQGKERMEKMKKKSYELGEMQKKLNRHEAVQSSLTNFFILLFSFGMLFFMLWNYENGNVTYQELILSVTAMMGSFGPVVALANLSNNLNQTLASGERVLSLLEETPQVKETEGKEATVFKEAKAEGVSFSYEEEEILKDYTISFPKGKVVGIHGASGSGKSTLLRLLMRFWDVEQGSISISGKNIKEVNTQDLRNMESYVTQETYLFHDSLANNIAVGKPGASLEEIQEAAKKASVHDFIMSLPKGYDTKTGELGDTLSGGEKQRIGIARAFLHDAPFLLLDEPTSNLDSLNEGMILKALKESREDKTIVLVSHRESTMNLADVVYEMENGRIS